VTTSTRAGPRSDGFWPATCSLAQEDPPLRSAACSIAPRLELPRPKKCGALLECVTLSRFPRSEGTAQRGREGDLENALARHFSRRDRSTVYTLRASRSSFTSRTASRARESFHRFCARHRRSPWCWSKEHTVGLVHLEGIPIMHAKNLHGLFSIASRWDLSSGCCLHFLDHIFGLLD
jgi:hypothetical protein